MLTRYTAFVHRARANIVVAALVFALVAAALGLSVAHRLGPPGFTDSTSDSARADAAIDADGGLQQNLTVLLRDASVHRHRDRVEIARVRRLISQTPLVARVYLSAASRGGRLHDTYLAVDYRHASEQSRQRATQAIERSLRGQPGVAVGGPDATNPQLSDTVQTDVERAELIGLPVLFILSLIVFRGLVAAALPPLIGGLTILGTFLMLRAVARSMEISILSLNLVTALGLGLAVDYSLFMVSRYREELVRGRPQRDALRVTLATAGRTVLFSATTIATVMSALLVFPQSFLSSMGLGGLIVALLSGVASLLVLPAILSILGPRVNALAPERLRRSAEQDAKALRRGAWYRLAAFVTARSGVVAILTGAGLLILAGPALRAEFVPVDASVLPQSTGARQVYNALSHDGLLIRSNPVMVLAQHARGAHARSLARDLRRLPHVAAVARPRPLRNHDWMIAVVTDGGAYGHASQQVVRDIRARPAAAGSLVTGPTARFIDLEHSLASHLPAVIVIVTLVTMLALYLMTGSVLLGLKTVLMNLLTYGAVLGLLVRIFQDGNLQGLLAYHSQAALEATAPALLFAAVFALSTDYGVFLLARIKEARDAGSSDDESVALGQERTGRAITSAALLFCVAVGAFATSSVIGVKETTLGIALAVLIDATLVRALLVPALMHILGGWNWWAPEALARLHRRLGLSDTAVAARRGRAAGTAAGVRRRPAAASSRSPVESLRRMAPSGARLAGALTLFMGIAAFRAATALVLTQRSTKSKRGGRRR